MFNSFLVKRILTLLILSYAFFFFGNSILSLTDPDETFYSLTAKEMAAKDDWVTPYIFNQPQFEKPIFTYWLLRVAFDLFGQTPFSARFFPALFACFGVLAVYAIGMLGFKNERKAFWSAVVLCTGGLYAGMGKTVFTDLIFTVFILYALLSFYLAYCVPQRKIIGFLGFYVFSALAVLTKGPLGLTIAEFTVILFLLYRRQIGFILNPWMLVGLLICLGLCMPWYVVMYQKYGHAFIHEFFYNDHWRRVIEAEHKGNDRWFFYPFTMIIGLFPWSLFLAGACVAMYKKLKSGLDGFEYFILSWVLVVFIIFQPAHSKLTSYILPMFPALALLAGGYIGDALNSAQIKRINLFLLIKAGALSVLGIVVLAAYPVYKKYSPSMLPVFFLSGSLIVSSGVMLSLYMRERTAAALGVLSITPLIFLWSAFMTKSDIEPYVSSYDAAQYLPHYPGQKTTILTSKPNARGVRYYTGQDVAVLDINGGNYFSPHPVPIFTTNEQLTQFLLKQKITYAVLKKGGFKTVSLLPADQFRVRLLAKLGYHFIVTIEPSGLKS